MVHTFSSLKTRVMRHLDETATTAPTTDALVEELLNAANQQRAIEYPWEFMLWPEEVSLSVVAGTKDYALHQEFQRPLYFWDATLERYLEEVPQRMLTPEHHAGNGGDLPEVRFIYGGLSCVRRQPAGSPVTAVSTSASDSSTQWVLLKGEDASGDVVVESLTLNGTTPVVGTLTFDRLLDVTKSDELLGTLTLKDASDNTLLTLNPSEMGRQYRQLSLLVTPTAARTVRYRFFRQPLKMVNDFDKPSIPGAHAQLLVWDTLVMLGGYLTDVNSQTLNVWRQQQQEAQLALYQAYANDGQTLGSVPMEVHTARRGWVE